MPHHCPATSASDIAVNASRCPAEEMRNQPWNDDAQTEQRAEKHADQARDKACEKPDDDGIGSKGKHRRAVERRLRIFH